MAFPGDLPAPLHAAYDRTLEYIRRVLVATDMYANVLLDGNEGDTISYQAAIARLNGKRWGCIMCKLLNIFQQDHCGKTIAAYDAQAEADAAMIAKGGHPQ